MCALLFSFAYLQGEKYRRELTTPIFSLLMGTG